MECPECNHVGDEEEFTDFEADGRYPDWVMFLCPECGAMSDGGE